MAGTLGLGESEKWLPSPLGRVLLGLNFPPSKLGSSGGPSLGRQTIATIKREPRGHVPCTTHSMAWHLRSLPVAQTAIELRGAERGTFQKDLWTPPVKFSGIGPRFSPAHSLRPRGFWSRSPMHHAPLTFSRLTAKNDAQAGSGPHSPGQQPPRAWQ